MVRGAVGALGLDGQVGVHARARVLEGDGLLGVDGPAGDTGDEGCGGCVGERVVQRPGAARVHVGGLARSRHALPPGAFDGLDRVFLRVGVEVADQQRRFVRVACRERRQGRGLGDADRVGVSLPIPAIGVTVPGPDRHGPLGLEVVGDHHEGRGGRALGGAPHELLGQRLACKARESRVVVDDGVPDRRDGRGLVDEGDADDVLAGRDGRRRGHVCPHVGSQGLVQGGHEPRQGGVAVTPHPHGDGVFDLFQGDHVGPQRVDRGDNLGFLVGEGLTRVGPSYLACLGRHEGAGAVRVARASGLVDAQVGEVVEDVEGRHARVPGDRGCARPLPGDDHGRSVGMPGDHGGRLKDKGPMPRLQDDGSGEGHVIAHARGSPVGQVRVGHLGRRALQQVRVRPVVEGDHPRGVGRLKVACGLPRRDHVGRGAQRLRARCEHQRPILIRRIVVCDRPGAQGGQEHGFVGLGPIRRGHAGDRSGSHGLAPRNLTDGRGRQLGQARGVFLRGRRRELADHATDAHARPQGRNLAVLPRVDEQRVRADPPLIPRAATARRLDGVAVQGGPQPGFPRRVGGRHDADRGEGSPHHRRVIPHAHRLDVRDRGIDGRTVWRGILSSCNRTPSGTFRGRGHARGHAPSRLDVGGGLRATTLGGAQLPLPRH